MANGHIYQHPLGWKVPSPTGIIGQLDKSGPLTYWAANCACDYILEELQNLEGDSVPKETLYSIIEAAKTNFRSIQYEALDVGSKVHEAIKYFLTKGIEPHIDNGQILAGFIAFLEWRGKHHLEVVETEHTVYDKDGWYAGTLDLLARLDGKLYLIDFKTSKQPRNNRPYEEWIYQLSAYRSCVDGVEGMGILRLDKTTGFPDWYDLSQEYERGLKVFKLLTKVWWLRHPRYMEERRQKIVSKEVKA